MDRHGNALRRGRCLFATLLLFAPALLAQNLSVRLVEAHNQSSQVAKELSDVSAMLQRMLPYTGFRLLDSSTASLPQGAAASMGAYTVKTSGPANACTVTIHKGKKQLLRTQVSLKGDTPLVVGGFPANGGKHLFVLKLR